MNYTNHSRSKCRWYSELFAQEILRGGHSLRAMVIFSLHIRSKWETICDALHIPVARIFGSKFWECPYSLNHQPPSPSHPPPKMQIWTHRGTLGCVGLNPSPRLLGSSYVETNCCIPRGPIRSQHANMYVNQSNNIIGKAVYSTQENCINTILGLTMSKNQDSLGAKIIHSFDWSGPKMLLGGKSLWCSVPLWKPKTVM